MNKAPHERLIGIIKKLPRQTAQNRLLGTTDREIALSMMYLPEQDRLYIYTLLSGKKAQRIREEIILHERLHITYKQYRIAVEQVIDKLTRPNVKSSFRSYLRPRR